jgi:hypothetical protein
MKFFTVSSIALLVCLGITLAFVVQELHDVSERAKKCEVAHEKLFPIDADVLKSFNLRGGD